MGGVTPPDTDARRHAPATARNRDAILAVLREALPARGAVLEVASGSGEHIVHFARALPGLLWQPSDPDPAARASIAAWAAEAGLANVRLPLDLDAVTGPWPPADAVLCINMVHISPWAATLGLLRGSAAALPAGAPLILYGPYIEDEMATAPSNIAFDQSLKARNPDWGLRNVADMDRAAAGCGFARVRRMEMPANNLGLVFRRV